MTAALAPDLELDQRLAHVDSLLQRRHQILLRFDRLSEFVPLGLLLRALRFERREIRLELPEVGGEHALLAFAQRRGNVVPPDDRRNGVEPACLRGDDRYRAPRRLGASRGEAGERLLFIGLGGRAIELDEHFSGGDARAVDDMDRRDLAGLEGLDHFDAARRLELALRDRDNVDAPEIGPGERDGDKRADDPDQSDADGRGRRTPGFRARARETRCRPSRTGAALSRFRMGAAACSRHDLHRLALQAP